MWESMRYCQVAHSLSLSRLSFHLIKVYIYVKLLVHWMCQWSQYMLIIYKYALIIYIYKNSVWFFFKKNYIRKKKKSHKRRKYTLLWVYASSLSQAGGTYNWWVPPTVRGEKHTPITRCIFRHIRDHAILSCGAL